MLLFNNIKWIIASLSRDKILLIKINIVSFFDVWKMPIQGGSERMQQLGVEKVLNFENDIASLK